MSRGPGRVQRKVIELAMKAVDDTGFPRPVTVDEVLLALSVDSGIDVNTGSTDSNTKALCVDRAHTISRAERESVRRAMRVLDAAGRIDLFTVRESRTVRIPTWSGTRHEKADKWILAARRILTVAEEIQDHDRRAADLERRAAAPEVQVYAPQWAEEWTRKAEWHRAEAARLQQVSQ